MGQSSMKRAAGLCLAACIATGGGTAAEAGPDRISVLIASEHVGATRTFEEVNPGAFLVWEEILWKNRLDVAAGAFRNSYGDGSAAVSAAYPVARGDIWSFDLFGALAWYPGNGHQFSHAWGDMVPLAGVQGRYGPLFMQAIPASGSGADAVLSFGLTFSLR